MTKEEKEKEAEEEEEEEESFGWELVTEDDTPSSHGSTDTKSHHPPDATYSVARRYPVGGTS